MHHHHLGAQLHLAGDLLDPESEREVGWVASCTCGWVSRPRETRAGSFRSWNRHASNAFEQAQHELVDPPRS